MCGETEVALDQLDDYVTDILAVPLEQSAEHSLIELEFKVGEGRLHLSATTSLSHTHTHTHTHSLTPSEAGSG